MDSLSRQSEQLVEGAPMFIAQHLSASELEAIAICFDTIRQVHRRLASNDEVLANKFNNGLKQMMEHLQTEM